MKEKKILRTHTISAIQTIKQSDKHNKTHTHTDIYLYIYKSKLKVNTKNEQHKTIKTCTQWNLHKYTQTTNRIAQQTTQRLK